MWSVASVTLLLLPICLHNVVSERLQFLAIPKRLKILSRGSNLRLDCTTNNQTAHTAVFYRRKTGQLTWKKIEAVPGKVIKEGDVYTLLNVTRINKGQYQCRAWQGAVNAGVTWPNNVGKFIIRRGSKTPGQKRPRRKKAGHKRSCVKKPGQKGPGQKKPWKKPGSRKPGHKKPGHKKQGHKKPGHKKPCHKKPGNKKPRNKKRPGSRKPGPRRPGKNRPGSKKSGAKKQGAKKQPKPQIKVVSKSVAVNEGSVITLKCSAKSVKRSQEPKVSWYRFNRLIGCSDKKDSRCTSSPPYTATYQSITRPGGTKKAITHLKIANATRARDQGSYECRASTKYGSAMQIIQVTVR